MRSNPRIFQRAGLMYYPRKRSGSMPAEPVRPLHILGEIRLRRAMPITHRVVSTKRVMRVTMPRTLGAFLICMEMYGSGRRTGRRNLRTGAQTDPNGAASGSARVIRGGSWNFDGTSLRSARRSDNAPGQPLRQASAFRVGFKQQ